MTMDAPGAGLCGRVSSKGEAMSMLDKFEELQEAALAALQPGERVFWQGVRQPRPPLRDETRNNGHSPQNVIGINS